MNRLWSSKIFHRMLPLIWVPLLFVYWGNEYNKGTFRGVVVTLLAAPYQENAVLKYLWAGDIYQSCSIVIDRKIITSEGVVITLKSSPLLSPLPIEELGQTEFPLSVETPEGLPDGQTIYQATERPRCTWLQSLFPPKIDYPPVRFVVSN